MADHDGPIPLSFPAILRNPGIIDRYGQHLKTIHVAKPTVIKRNRRDENEGRRWVRRKENARFIGNPHISLPTKTDAVLQPVSIKNTFPEPLPSYLPRTAKLPQSSAPAFDPTSANFGRYTLSLRGMRRDLRKSGYRAQLLVDDVEREIQEWLNGEGTLASPDSDAHRVLHNPGRPIRNTGTIFEASRTPIQLVWRISDDAFARYVVHCCCRYHEIVSFSKDVLGERLTYLLRPNVAKPDAHALYTMDTPPATDLEYSSVLETGSEFTGSDREILSDVGESDLDSDPQSPQNDGQLLGPTSEADPLPSTSSKEDEWSMVENSEAEGGDESENESLAASINSLSIQHTAPLDMSLSPPTTIRSRLTERQQIRSSSSPSRSPSRRRSRKQLRSLHARRQRRMPLLRPRCSFYEFLFGPTVSTDS